MFGIKVRPHLTCPRFVHSFALLNDAQSLLRIFSSQILKAVSNYQFWTSGVLLKTQKNKGIVFKCLPVSDCSILGILMPLRMCKPMQQLTEPVSTRQFLIFLSWKLTLVKVLKSTIGISVLFGWRSLKVMELGQFSKHSIFKWT
jgi:hypothetical protein